MGTTRERIDLGDRAWVEYTPRWWPDHLAVMGQILGEVDVKRIPITAYGRPHLSSRLMANAGAGYRYSSASLPGAEWTPTLAGMRDAVTRELGRSLNQCLVSYYPNGQAHVGYHRDPGTVRGAPIACVSLGGRRTFALERDGERRTWELGDGDLFVMDARCVVAWRHSVPRRKWAEPRLSVTFRQLAV